MKPLSGNSIYGWSKVLTIGSKQRSSNYLVIASMDGPKFQPLDQSRGLKKIESKWLAPTPSKRWGEVFFLAYTPFWLMLCLGIIVPYRLYESFTELEYLLVGLISAVPSIILPLIFVGKEDVGKPWWDRYWVKASVWIAIFSYVGNFFWTHYFFTVLGASYTFPSWKFNNVPWTTFFLAHICFLFYHMVSNITIRRLRYALEKVPSKIAQWFVQALWILALSYLTAFMEAWAISSFPYYDFVDRDAMYKVGSLFYGLYFIVSYPMFFRLDEEPNHPWSLSQTAIDSLGAAMLVTILLDVWRHALGPIVDIPGVPSYKDCLKYGIPWMS